MTQKILIAEDEMIVAFDLCDTVEEAGFYVEGPHAGISSAMLAFQVEKPDLAILDAALNDGSTYELARRMAAENVPIIFYASTEQCDQISQRFPDATTLAKPCPPAAMLRAVSDALIPVQVQG